MKLLALVTIAVTGGISSTAAAHNRPVTRAESIIRQVFGTNASKALRVAYCETGGTFSPRAANPGDHHSDGSRGSWGLFQVGSLHRSRGESVESFRQRMFDPWQNARLAYRLSRGGTSWGPWSCG